MMPEDIGDIYDIVVQEGTHPITFYTEEQKKIENVFCRITPAKSENTQSQNDYFMTNTTTINILTQYTGNLENCTFQYNNKWFKVKSRKVNSLSVSNNDNDGLLFVRYTAISTIGEL